MEEPNTFLAQRLAGLLPFLGIAAPDLGVRFRPRIEAATDQTERELIERELLAALAPH